MNDIKVITSDDGERRSHRHAGSEDIRLEGEQLIVGEKVKGADEWMRIERVYNWNNVCYYDP